MHVWLDRNIERHGGRIATMEVSYARLVEMSRGAQRTCGGAGRGEGLRGVVARHQ